MNKTKGFTLIELLISMTIIAVIMGLALVSFQGARTSARDNRKKADLEQIRSALETCYADLNNYPGVIYTDVTCGSNTYLANTPKNPSSGLNYSYTPIGVGGTYTSYAISVALESGGTYIVGPNGVLVATPIPTQASTPIPTPTLEEAPTTAPIPTAPIPKATPTSIWIEM